MPTVTAQLFHGCHLSSPPRLHTKRGMDRRPFVNDALAFDLPQTPFIADSRRDVCITSPAAASSTATPATHPPPNKKRWFELWSVNGGSHSFYPGPSLLPLPPASSIPPPPLRRVDGSLGRFDWSVIPQHFHPSRPWLGFVERVPSSLNTISNPTSINPELLPVPMVWTPNYDGSIMGKLDKTHYERLVKRSRFLDAKIAQARGRMDESSIEWINRPLYPDRFHLEDLADEMEYMRALDWITAIQRGIKEKAAWLRMFESLPLRPCCSENTSSSTASKQIPIPAMQISRANNRFMGVWLNGTSASDAQWLIAARVPCFIIHAYRPGVDFPQSLPSSHPPSGPRSHRPAPIKDHRITSARPQPNFYAGTDLESRFADKSDVYLFVAKCAGTRLSEERYGVERYAEVGLDEWSDAARGRSASWNCVDPMPIPMPIPVVAEIKEVAIERASSCVDVECMEVQALPTPNSSCEMDVVVDVDVVDRTPSPEAPQILVQPKSPPKLEVKPPPAIDVNTTPNLPPSPAPSLAADSQPNPQPDPQPSPPSPKKHTKPKSSRSKAKPKPSGEITSVTDAMNAAFGANCTHGGVGSRLRLSGRKKVEREQGERVGTSPAKSLRGDEKPVEEVEFSAASVSLQAAPASLVLASTAMEAVVPNAAKQPDAVAENIMLLDARPSDPAPISTTEMREVIVVDDDEDDVHIEPVPSSCVGIPSTTTAPPAQVSADTEALVSHPREPTPIVEASIPPRASTPHTPHEQTHAVEAVIPPPTPITLPIAAPLAHPKPLPHLVIGVEAIVSDASSLYDELYELDPEACTRLGLSRIVVPSLSSEQDEDGDGLMEVIYMQLRKGVFEMPECWGNVLSRWWVVDGADGEWWEGVGAGARDVWEGVLLEEVVEEEPVTIEDVPMVVDARVEGLPMAVDEEPSVVDAQVEPYLEEGVEEEEEDGELQEVADVQVVPLTLAQRLASPPRDASTSTPPMGLTLSIRGAAAAARHGHDVHASPARPRIPPSPTPSHSSPSSISSPVGVSIRSPPHPHPHPRQNRRHHPYLPSQPNPSSSYRQSQDPQDCFSRPEFSRLPEKRSRGKKRGGRKHRHETKTGTDWRRQDERDDGWRVRKVKVPPTA